MYRINTQYDLETTAMFWYLQLRGIRVSYYGNQGDSAIDWCMKNITGKWGWHHKSVLISQEDLVNNIDYHFNGKWPVSPNDAEDMMAKAMARQISDAIDDDVLSSLGIRVAPKPTGFFWFEDPSTATLFKLTWGGE